MSEMALRFRVEASMAEAKASLDQGAAAFRKFGADANTAMKQASTGYSGLVSGMSRDSAITGNVAAQFNDIFVMIAAGQNPLQTAIQQGTQLTQVMALAGGGAKGAANALKAGFMAMLSPTTLLTIAIIAGGAALVQWLTGAGDAAVKAKTLEEAVNDLESAISNFEKQSSSSLEDLKKKFGEVTPEVVRLNTEMTDLAGAQAIIAATEALRSLKAATEGSWFAAFTEKAFSEQAQIADMLGVVEAKITSGRGGSFANPIIKQFQDAIAEASSARGFDAQIASIRAVEDVIIEAAGGIGNMTLKQTELLAEVQATEAAIRQQKAAMGNAVEVEGNAVEVEEKAIEAIRKKYAIADAHLEKLRQEAVILQAIREYGEDSAQVSVLRLEAERKTHDAMVDALEISLDLKDKLKQAWEAAHGLSQEDIARGISAASGIADTLARNLLLAFQRGAALAALADRAGQAPPARPDDIDFGYEPPVTPGGVTPKPRPFDIDFGLSDVSSSGGGGSTSGSLSSLSSEAQKALAELDLAIATINEKVKAGLMSTAEAGDAVSGARQKAGNDIASLIAQIDKLGPAGKAAATALRVSLMDVTADLQKPIDDLSKSLSAGLSGPLKDFMKNAKTADEVFKAFGDSVIDKLIDIALQQAQVNLFEPLISGFLGSLSGGGGGLAASIGEAFGLGGAGAKLSGAESALRVASGSLSGSKIAAGPSASQAGLVPQVNVKIEGVPAGHTASVDQKSSGMDQMLTVVIEKVEAAIGSNIRSGRGSVGNAISDTYGMNRRPR